jgi:hypothetical protein
MLAVHATGTEPGTPRPDPEAGVQAVAERGLRSSRYSALKHVSCDYRGGVLVLRGCLPTYYLKQMAQEVVAHQFDPAEPLDNQIQVVRPAPR